MFKRTLLFLALTIFLNGYKSSAQSPKEILKEVVSAIDNVQDMTYTFKQKERMIKGWNEASTLTKLQAKPFRVYLKTITPDPDIEVLYGDGKYGGKALINASRFIPNIKLNPTHKRMLGTQHHSISSCGFSKIKSTLQDGLSRGESAGATFELAGSKNYDGKDCYVIKIDYPNFGFSSYTVQKGEDLFDIGKKHKVSEYMIMANNEGVDNYFDVKAGQKIKIPNAYAKHTILYVDKKTKLPIYQKMDDDKGLFEEYSFLNLSTNLNIPDEEFSESHKEYGF